MVGDGIGTAYFKFNPDSSRTIVSREQHVGAGGVAKHTLPVSVEYVDFVLATPTCRTGSCESFLQKSGEAAQVYLLRLLCTYARMRTFDSMFV